MELCLVRHAIAEERGPQYPDDGLRPLSSRGRKRMAEAAAGLRAFFVPEVILTSPLVRARQTAEILAVAYGQSSIEELEALATGDNQGLVAVLTRLGAERALVVGHEPSISMALSLLLTGNEHRLLAVFKKGAGALVTFEDDLEPGSGTLEWLLQPGQLRAVARS